MERNRCDLMIRVNVWKWQMLNRQGRYERFFSRFRHHHNVSPRTQPPITITNASLVVRGCQKQAFLRTWHVRHSCWRCRALTSIRDLAGGLPECIYRGTFWNTVQSVIKLSPLCLSLHEQFQLRWDRDEEALGRRSPSHNHFCLRFVISRQERASGSSAPHRPISVRRPHPISICGAK